MSTTHEWTFADGWILMSVYVAHGDDGATLQDIIAAADGMNHAIPTDEELSTSLTKLASCGILTKQKTHFKIADAYLPMLAKVQAGKGGWFSTPDKGKKWLSQTEFDWNRKKRVNVTQQQSQTAYDQYWNRFRQSK